MDKINIALVGDGNMAWFLANNLVNSQFKINEIYVRKNKSELCEKLNIKKKEIKDFESEIILLAVNDSSILEILKKDNLKNKKIGYFAGSLDVGELKPYCENIFCIWPIYSISKLNLTTNKNIPIAINASNELSKNIARKIASNLSTKIIETDDEQKKYLHLCATIVNNFSNHLFHIAERICYDAKLDSSILLPLFENTVEKLKTKNALENQTGPAIRNDEITIAKHLKLIKKPNYKRIYEDITKSIQDENNL